MLATQRYASLMRLLLERKRKREGVRKAKSYPIVLIFSKLNSSMISSNILNMVFRIATRDWGDIVLESAVNPAKC
jgi:hypothetical protein